MRLCCAVLRAPPHSQVVLPPLITALVHHSVGDKLAVVGPNGAGKSTLLKILGGQLDHDSGQISRNKVRAHERGMAATTTTTTAAGVRARARVCLLEDSHTTRPSPPLHLARTCMWRPPSHLLLSCPSLPLTHAGRKDRLPAPG